MAIRLISRLIDWPLHKLQKLVWRAGKPNTRNENFYLTNMSFSILKLRLKIFNKLR